MSQFERIEKQFLQEVQKTSQDCETLDATNLLRIENEVMFVQIPEKYTEFSKMPAHIGIKRFGEEAISAMLSEYIQLDKGAVEVKPVIDAVNTSMITDKQRLQALNAVNLIKKIKPQ